MKLAVMIIGLFALPVSAQDMLAETADAEPSAGLNLECLLQPYVVVNLGSPVSGVLETVRVRRGDVVQKNAIVASMNTDVEAAAVESAKTRVDFTQRTLARNEELYKGDLLPQQKKDEVLTENVLAKLALRESQAMLERRIIRSPITGVVTERLKAPGDFVQETEIVRIAQLDPLNVEVVVPVSYFGSITQGMMADVLPEEPIGGVYKAKVTVVDQVIDAASGTFGVRLEIPNPDLKLPAGLRCNVDIPVN